MNHLLNPLHTRSNVIKIHLLRLMQIIIYVSTATVIELLAMITIQKKWCNDKNLTKQNFFYCHFLFKIKNAYKTYNDL